jgi:hypothetical protein
MNPDLFPVAVLCLSFAAAVAVVVFALCDFP